MQQRHPRPSASRRLPRLPRGFSAPAPEGIAPGSPFGPGLAALVLHLHVTQAISFERLVRLMDEVFGLTLSEGAIANLLARSADDHRGREHR